MSLTELVDFFKKRETSRRQVIPLPDPGAVPSPAAGHDGDGGEYFQIRLEEMYLTDERRWHQEVDPAAFLLADFNYAGRPVRKPFFASSGLLSGFPTSIDPAKLRVKLTNTLVLGPTPYDGGDVALLVGLFQTPVKDWRAVSFSIMEKLFGPTNLSPVAQAIKLADTLSGEILQALGASEVKCVTAERHALGAGAAPRNQYLVYLGNGSAEMKAQDLAVVEHSLKRVVNGETHPYEESDFCLVRVETLASRNDYSSLGFHRAWSDARLKVIEGKTDEAQALMLDCARQIFSSPDLTEGDKERLMKYYQAKLHTAPQLGSDVAPELGRERAGSVDVLGTLQLHALAANEFDSAGIQQVYSELLDLATQLDEEPDAVDEDANIERYLTAARARPAAKPAAGKVLHALEIGSITAQPRGRQQ